MYSFKHNEKSDREIKETIPFTVAKKRLKYLGISLPKETKDLYTENDKMVMKKIKDNTNRWRYIPIFMDWNNQYCENYYATPNNLQIQCNPYQITNDIFHRTRTKNV